MAEETTTESITTDTAALSIETTDDAAPKVPVTPSSAAKGDEPLVLTEDDEGERGELESEIRAKDASISGLDKLRQEKQQELESLQKELDEERLLQMKESIHNYRHQELEEGGKGDAFLCFVTLFAASAR